MGRRTDGDLDAQRATGGATEIGRLVLFCLVSFGLAGVTASVLVQTGGLADSRVLVPNTPITVAVVLLPTAYMFSPAFAHVVTRALTRQGWSDLGCAPTGPTAGGMPGLRLCWCRRSSPSPAES